MIKRIIKQLFAKPPSRAEVKRAEDELDSFMRGHGGRKLNPLYRPRRRRVKDDMKPGDIKTVGRIYTVK